MRQITIPADDVGRPMRRPTIAQLDFPYPWARRELPAKRREARARVARRDDRSAIVAWQTARLNALLQHAIVTCPFYARTLTPWVTARGLECRDDLVTLPPLTRRHLQSNLAGICSNEADLTHAFVKRSSGSTGEPVCVVVDHAMSITSNQLLLEWIAAWGVATHELRPERTAVVFVSAFPSTTSFEYRPPEFGSAPFLKLSMYRGHWGTARDAVTYLCRLRPVILTGLPEHLLEVCSTGRREGRCPHPRLVVSSGAHLSAAAREEIETCLRAPVMDAYTMTEVGYVGAKCPKAQGYHVDEGVIVEVVDSRGRLQSAGMPGELVVTSLRNWLTPLIRYRTGDIGRLASEACTCGSAWPVISIVEGRITQRFLRSDGAWENPFRLFKCIGVAPVRQFQIRQLRVDGFEVDLVGAAPGAERAIRRHLLQELGIGIDVNVRRVRRIPSRGRKLRDFVCLVDGDRHE